MLLRSLLVIWLVFSVAACQNTDKNQIPLNYQITQLSSMIAATQYIRDYCSRSDIPNNAIIEKASMTAASNKGWDITVYNKMDENGFLPANRIKQRTQDIYRNLISDSTPQHEKCMEFNSSLASFLIIVKSQN